MIVYFLVFANPFLLLDHVLGTGAIVVRIIWDGITFLC